MGFWGRLTARNRAVLVLLTLIIVVGTVSLFATPHASTRQPPGSLGLSASPASSTVTATPTPDVTTASPSPPVTGYVQILNTLTVDDSAGGVTGYDRDLFHVWIDSDGDGCNTRAEVLLLQSLSPTTHHNRCTLDTGTWVSLYDGVTVTDASQVDIDHVVPLSEAWKSGAWRWDDATRTRFANDLGFPGSLLAVTASSNRSKGDSDPTTWMPVPSAACDYAQRWVAVKYRWSLTVDSAEKRVLTSTLSVCSEIIWALPELAPITLVP